MKIDLQAILATDDIALEQRKLIITLAWQIYDELLVGNRVPKFQSVYERMNHPQAGDLVFEQTTLWRRNNDELRFRGFGILKKIAEEPLATLEEWNGGEENESEWEPVPLDTFYYVQYGPEEEDVTRWSNCRFLAIPLDQELFC